MSHFGHWIKERRETLDLTQATLAQQIGMSVATVRNWEHAQQMPRISLPIKAALAQALRMNAADLEAIGRGEQHFVPLGPPPKGKQDAHPRVKIENYDRAQRHLRGVANTESMIREGGFLPYKLTSPQVNEFAWIVEDDSMAGLDGYVPGDILMFMESTSIPAGSDVMVEVHGRGLGIVRRIFYHDDRAILTALGRKYPPQILALKDVSSMAMAIGLIRAI